MSRPAELRGVLWTLVTLRDGCITVNESAWQAADVSDVALRLPHHVGLNAPCRMW